MKRTIAIASMLVLVCAAVIGQALKPLSVSQHLRGTGGLLELRPITNQTVIVLGENTPLDVPIRLGIHGASWGSANDVDIFNAIGGGQWRLVGLSGSAGIQSTVTIQADDTTRHDVSIEYDQGQYIWSISQSNSVNSPSYVILGADDSTKHQLLVVLADGLYTLSVEQSASSSQSSAMILRHSDSTEHELGVVLDQGTYNLTISQ